MPVTWAGPHLLSLATILTPQFAGAFWGALLGMVAFQGNDALGRARGRQRAHHRALVALEHGLNRQLEYIGTDLTITGTVIKTARAATRSMATPHQIPDHGAIVLDLAEMELVNELVTVQTGIDRINRDLKHLERAYLELWQLRVAHPEHAGDVSQVLLQLADAYSTVRDYLLLSRIDVQHCLARVRLMAPRDKPRGLVLRVHSYSPTEGEIRAEHARLNAEIGQLAETHARAIAEQLKAIAAQGAIDNPAATAPATEHESTHGDQRGQE